MSDFAKDLAASEPIKSFKVGEIVAGTAIVANQKMILVDLDGQFTGIITGAHMHSSTEDSTSIEPGARIESIVIGEDAHSGLIHLSEIPADMAKTLEEKVHAGEMMKARIITFDPIAKRIGLSLKALDPNYVPPTEVPDVPAEALEA
jgi:ribosomal protein S1